MNALRIRDFQAIITVAKQKLVRCDKDQIECGKVCCDLSIALFHKVKNYRTQQLAFSSVIVLALLAFPPLVLAENDLHLATDDVTSDKVAYVKFIKFEPSEYQNEKDGEIEAVINELKRLPENSIIRLIGHSQSRTNLATENLALDRALVVKEKLIDLGIVKENIELNTEIANNKNEGDLLHGVLLLALPPLTTEINTPLIAEQTAGEETDADTAKTAQYDMDTNDDQSIADKTNTTIEQNEQPLTATISKDLNQTIEQPEMAQTPTPETKVDKKPMQYIDVENTVEIDLCDQVIMKEGSLKTNLEREIGDCGYVMGDWKFSSKTELIDWNIPISYSVIIEDGIFGILSLVEKNYQIRAHIHQLDKSIDFLSSVRHRRDLK